MANSKNWNMQTASTDSIITRQEWDIMILSLTHGMAMALVSDGTPVSDGALAWAGDGDILGMDTAGDGTGPTMVMDGTIRIMADGLILGMDTALTMEADTGDITPTTASGEILTTT